MIKLLRRFINSFAHTSARVITQESESTISPSRSRGFTVEDHGSDETANRVFAAASDILCAMFAALSDVVLALDSDGGRLSIAPANDTLLYTPPTELIGKTLHEVFPEKEADFFLHNVCRALQARRTHRVEYQLALGSHTAWFDASVSPISNNSVLWIAHDITSAKCAEEELRRQLHFTEAVTASLGEGVYALDQNGLVTFMNPAAEAALGWKLTEVIGRNMHELIHHQRADGTRMLRSECPLLSVLRTGKTIKVEKDVFVRRDGTLMPVSYTASAIATKGKVSGAALAFHDISHQQLLEEQLRQAQKMEAIGQLAGGIAHDFNNLLTIISGYSARLVAGETAGSVKQKELLEIQRAGERAALLTQRLLAFSCRQLLKPRVVPLNTVVTGVEPMLRRMIPEDIDIAVQLNSATGNVKVDVAQLEQVVINLSVNARDAMPDGGKLTIETTNATLDELYVRQHPQVTAGPYALLVITDTGVGMDNETKTRIFEPFFTTKDTGTGTGLGLSMAYGVVRQSGGHIWVYSEPSAGSTFKIYLPLVSLQMAPLPAVGHDSLQQAGQETILLVEDDDGLRDLVAATLIDNGYFVISARDAADALEQAAALNDPIDLLITDVIMPGKSGASVAKQLAGERPAMKVLYMSGYTDAAIVRHGMLNADMAFLTKPFSPTALALKVREVLNGGLV